MQFQNPDTSSPDPIPSGYGRCGKGLTTKLTQIKGALRWGCEGGGGREGRLGHGKCKRPASLDSPKCFTALVRSLLMPERGQSGLNMRD